MSLIVDCSVAIGWFVATQSTPLTDKARLAILDAGGVVPFIFPVEFGNSILILERRKRLTTGEVDRTIVGIGNLELDVDGEALDALRQLVPLARTYGLTTYDAAYLELALRTGLPLATRDDDLAAAARAAGAPLFAP